MILKKLATATCYWYSKYRESFTYEASGRRGGFDFSAGLFEGRMAGKKGDCVIMEIAQQIIKRTNGNVPVIHFNCALDFARQYNSRMRAMRLDRGY